MNRMPTLLKAVYAALEGADLIGPNADLENEIAAALEEWEDEPSLASRLAGGFAGAERERGREAALVRKHLPLANDMITMLHDDLTTIADRANLLSPGNYSVIVLLDDETWEQPTYRVREPMSEQELKAHAELNCRGFMSFAPQRDDDCPPDQVREIPSAARSPEVDWDRVHKAEQEMIRAGAVPMLCLTVGDVRTVIPDIEDAPAMDLLLHVADNHDWGWMDTLDVHHTLPANSLLLPPGESKETP